jgi:GNAT superfamily N-acetyltransferase
VRRISSRCPASRSARCAPIRSGPPASIRCAAPRLRESFDVGHTRLILLGGLHAGCVTAQPRADHWELRDFPIEPAHPGRGLGGAALRALLNEDAQRRTRLEVLKGSRAARLCLRHGFRCIARQDFDDLCERPPGLA